LGAGDRSSARRGRWLTFPAFWFCRSLHPHSSLLSWRGQGALGGAGRREFSAGWSGDGGGGGEWTGIGALIGAEDGEPGDILKASPFDDVLAHDSFELEAGALVDDAGGGVTNQVVGVDAVEAQGAEGEVEHGGGGLGGVAVAPPVRSDPDAEFGPIVGAVDVADGDCADSGGAREDIDSEVCGTIEGPGTGMGGDPGFGVLGGEGVGERERGVSDLPVIGETGDAGGI